MAKKDRRPDAPSAGGSDQTWSGDTFSGAPESHPAGAGLSDVERRKRETKPTKETEERSGRRESRSVAESDELVRGERSMMGDGQFLDSSKGTEGRNPEGSAGLGDETYDELT